MADVVQLKCPHCQNTLRVPLSWADQPMRCKHCREVFQPKKKSPPTPVTPAKPPAAPPPAAVQKAPAGNPFAFEEPVAAVAPRAPATSRGPGPVKLVLLGCGVLT